MALLSSVARTAETMIAMEYMERGDKEEILEAIGTFAESVDRRFDAVERRFESIDQRFESIDKRFESIDRHNASVTKTLDWLVGHATKHDEELLMIARGMRRMSDDIDRIKPLVGLA
ncbi:hypothetical protein L0Y59_04260 [Candidatus Uhrbacteria bacterium]|nr:hypothetical protein [Candidatus Uhrbacteria bacterium]